MKIMDGLHRTIPLKYESIKPHPHIFGPKNSRLSKHHLNWARRPNQSHLSSNQLVEQKLLNI